jgi:hypothetical protein
MEFSNIYETSIQNGRWKLGGPVPLDTLGRIIAQHLTVTVRPGSGIDVEDRMRVAVRTPAGFASRLNHRARIRSVSASGVELPYRFGGGLFVAAIPEGEAEFVLEYSLEVESAPQDPNSGRFTPEFGHIRNQYLWHPLFEFNSFADQAAIEIEARIPKAYSLSTSLPQTERLDADSRVVSGKSAQPTFALTLAYDRAWSVIHQSLDNGVRFDLFATPEFRPEPDAVTERFRRLYGLLAGRFGEPPARYFSVVQLRGGSGNQWRFGSNQSVYAAGSPGHFSIKEPLVSAFFAHEIGHGWTDGAGPLANFLREGWATYVESLAIEQEFDPAVLRDFWRQHAANYFRSYEGKVAMWGSGNGSNLNYDKGAWLFRMLEEAAGFSRFNRAMAEFSRRSLAGDAGWETLADSFQHQNIPDFDASAFLLPWLREKQAPQLSVRVSGPTVTVAQIGPVFLLPLMIEAKTAAGIDRRLVWLRDPETSVTFSRDISEVRLDPSERLLLRTR